MRLACDLTRITIDHFKNDDLTTVFSIESAEPTAQKVVEPLPFLIKMHLSDTLKPQTEHDQSKLEKLAYFLLFKYKVTIKELDSGEVITYHLRDEDKIEKETDEQIEKLHDELYKNRGSSKGKELLAKMNQLQESLDYPEFLEIEQSKIDLLVKAMTLLPELNIEIILERDGLSFMLNAFTAFSEALDFYKSDHTDNEHTSIRSSTKLEIMKKTANVRFSEFGRKETLNKLIDIYSCVKKQKERRRVLEIFGNPYLLPSAHIYFNILHDKVDEFVIEEAFEAIWVLSYMKWTNVSFINKHVEASFYLMRGSEDLARSHEHMAKFIKKRKKEHE